MSELTIRCHIERAMQFLADMPAGMDDERVREDDLSPVDMDVHLTTLAYRELQAALRELGKEAS